MSAFETKTCDRCGGSGSHSFNLMHGSRCYGCGGTGKTLTKSGKAAQSLFRDLISVEPSKVQPGWLVWWSDINPMAAGKWVRVSDVQVASDGAVYFTTQGGRKSGIKGGKVRAVESINQRNAAVLQAIANTPGHPPVIAKEAA